MSNQKTLSRITDLCTKSIAEKTDTKIRLLKRMVLIIVFLGIVPIAGCGADAETKSSDAEGYALIYNGSVSDADSTQAIADVIKRTNLPVRYISDLEKLPMLLKAAKVFVIGGTEDDVEPLIEEFTPEIVSALKTYLHNGGRYLGVCGGAFVASVGWHEDDRFVEALGIVPAKSDAYDEDFVPKIYLINWLGEERLMYYQAGPTFDLVQSSESVEVIAYFENHQIAALMSSFGKGKVAVLGPHPEAPESWKASAVDGNRMEPNIYLAVNLLQELLSDQSVGQGKRI